VISSRWRELFGVEEVRACRVVVETRGGVFQPGQHATGRSWRTRVNEAKKNIARPWTVPTRSQREKRIK